MGQRELAIGLNGLHERIGHTHRNIEVFQVARVFGVNKLFNVRVVATQNAHLCPSAGTG